MKCKLKNTMCRFAGVNITFGCKELGEPEGRHDTPVCYNDEIGRDYTKCDKKPKIYISGPISGHELGERREVFEAAELILKSMNFEPANPIAEADRHPGDVTTHQHMHRDIALLLECDAIFMMRGWTHSKGCKVEFDVATAIGLPVYFEEVYMESKANLIKFE